MRTEKHQLRTRLLGHRRQLSTQEVQTASQDIFTHLYKLEIFQQARTLVLYSAEVDEVQTEAIWQVASRHDKIVYYPRITLDRADLEFVRRHPADTLIPGTFNILIPPGDEMLTSLEASDLVLVPGVGFDASGHRLGRGKGYYDRAFRGVLAGGFRVALAYAWQLVPRIPVDSHDEMVHFIVTEQGGIDCRAHSST
jgi:5-formyltetrahydrofolate cyclo-ligase